jgi:hypothetical protein
LTSKTEKAYNIAFNNLKIELEFRKIETKPKIIMCDFENGLRKSLRKCFKNSDI